jgi:pimeloyl-ACP methyl ester carboxylesterase
MDSVRSADGTLIEYERSGAGLPLVLLHGSSADHTRWARVLPGLGRHFTVYAVDRRGRGGSGDAVEYALQREVEDILAILESIGQPAGVLGHSYGGICALEAALLAANLRRLILYEPPINTVSVDLNPDAGAAALSGSLGAGDPDALAASYLRAVVGLSAGPLESTPPGSPTSVPGGDHLPIARDRLPAARTILREMRCANAYVFEPVRFAHLATPTLLMLGGQSAPLFRHMTEHLCSGLPNCRIVAMAGQEHAAMDTAPELFVQLITDFCKPLKGQE